MEYVTNPTTGRPVRRDGRVFRQLVRNGWLEGQSTPVIKKEKEQSRVQTTVHEVEKPVESTPMQEDEDDDESALMAELDRLLQSDGDEPQTQYF